MYLFLLYKALIYVYHFRLLFSAKKMIFTRPVFTDTLQDLVFVLNNHYSAGLGLACIVALSLLSLLGLFRRSNYLSNLLLWLLMLNLSGYLYATVTAGDYLLNQLLFFNIFFSARPGASPFFNDLKTAFHNMALAGIKVQVCLAYFLAGWFKLTDAAWLDGSAVQQIFQIPGYTSAILMSLPLWLCMVLNYATMAYQLLFPFTIWFRSCKIYLLAFGIIQHLVIAFGMGLFSFGIIMIICYILFLKYDDRSEAIRENPRADLENL